MSPDVAEIWPSLLAELRRTVPATQFDIWLAPLEPAELRDDVLVVRAPAELRAWVAGRFAGALRAAAAHATGRPAMRVDVQAAEDPVAAPGRAARGAAPAAPPPEPEPERLNPRFTFDQFVIGDTNRLAHAAALSVAELPANAYNPLFLYGPPGVGKTHLLHAIGNYVRAYGGGLTVRYTTVERFTNEFIAALQRGGIDAFKDRYRRTDVLLVDDVQFLASKVKTEEELFHTINALAEAGAQLVLTSDRLPADLEKVAERLRERFAAGLVTDIRVPDRTTRLAVLRKRAHHDGVAFAEDGVLEVLADRIEGNIRALEGALIRVVAFSSLTGEPITVALTERVVDDLYGSAPAPGTTRVRTRRPDLTVERIQEATCAAFGITREELVSPSRAARVAWPRQVAMFLAREHTDESLPRIGQRFGGRDHTTVLHACRRTAQRIATDPEADEAVRALTNSLLGTGADRC